MHAGVEDGAIPNLPGREESHAGNLREAELDLLSHIIANFNDLFGGIPWADKDRVGKTITEDIPVRAENDPAFRNARNTRSG
ncbi:MAG: hypothetical protein OXF25_06130 [Cyanobacteria bacterium MAG CAR3_bin_5]|nr:hypothetical protein [Cyanobacteria bacterium MAG CAR3_bin_5]MCY4235215.1 hypothetical protein [Cyanobacteria bacterium MAG CAR2_bin_4]